MNDDYVPEHRAGDDPVVGDAPPQANALLSNSVYDKAKWVSLVLLPALGAFYFGLAQLLGLPYGLEVVGVLALVDTFIGTVLGLSSKQYQNSIRQYQNSDARFDGRIVVSPGAEEDTTDLRVQLDPAAVAEKDEVTVKIERV